MLMLYLEMYKFGTSFSELFKPEQEYVCMYYKILFRNHCIYIECSTFVYIY